jgi:hypothetical protein
MKPQRPVDAAVRPEALTWHRTGTALNWSNEWIRGSRRRD